MLLTAYSLGLDKEFKRYTQQGFQSGSEEDAIATAAGLGFIVAIQFILALLVASAAAYLSYTLNRHLGTSTGLTIFYVILAALFSELYFIGYSFFFNPLNKSGSAASASKSRRNNSNI